MSADPGIQSKDGVTAHVVKAGELYAQLIKDQIQAENSRKSSLEQRGSWVATTSTGLTGILFALAAFNHKTSLAQLPRIAIFSAVPSIILLVVAAGLGIACSWPQAYRQIKTAELKRLTDPLFWDAASKAAERRVFETLVQNLDDSQRRNGTKAKILIVGMCAQVGAILLLAIAICTILI
jgi:uncharacterized membrane protein